MRAEFAIGTRSVGHYRNGSEFRANSLESVILDDEYLFWILNLDNYILFLALIYLKYMRRVMGTNLAQDAYGRKHSRIDSADRARGALTAV